MGLQVSGNEIAIFSQGRFLKPMGPTQSTMWIWSRCLILENKQNLIKQCSHFDTKLSKLNRKDRIFPPQADPKLKNHVKFAIKNRFWTEIQRDLFKGRALPIKDHTFAAQMNREERSRSRASSACCLKLWQWLKWEAFCRQTHSLDLKKETAWKRSHPFSPLDWFFFSTFSTARLTSFACRCCESNNRGINENSKYVRGGFV